MKAALLAVAVLGTVAIVILAGQRASAKESGPARAKAAADRVRPLLTRDLTKAGLSFGSPVFIRIFKEERHLELWMQQPGKQTYKLFRTYHIAAMSGSLGPKLAEGDRQAPEGFYFVPRSRMNPNSNFHLSFNLGYPNGFDRAHQRTGSALMVHGNKVSIGCFAMTDPKIEEIYTLCDAAHNSGQDYFRVHSFPFRMTANRMAQAKESKWHSFWQNLQQGYDLFEKSTIPPNTTVQNKRYTFQ